MESYRLHRLFALFKTCFLLIRCVTSKFLFSQLFSLEFATLYCRWLVLYLLLTSLRFSAPESLVFPYDFYPVNTSFWTCLFLWFHCLSEFSCKFLQQQSLCLSDHLDYKIPCLEAWLLKNYLVAMTYFLNFFMLLVLYPCFHIWNSRHLTSLLVAFGWVILLAGTVTWHFLCFYMGIPDLFLLLPRAEL